MTGTEAVTNPLESVQKDELMRMLVEAEEFSALFAKTIRDIRAELLTRVNRGEPYDYVVQIDGEDNLGMTVTAHRAKGAHRYQYNPKQVLRRLETLGCADTFTKRSLDTKTFNAALDGTGMMKDVQDIVTSKYDDDRLMVKGLNDLLKAKKVGK